MLAEAKTRAKHLDEDRKTCGKSDSHSLGLVLILERERHARPDRVN